MSQDPSHTQTRLCSDCPCCPAKPQVVADRSGARISSGFCACTIDFKNSKRYAAQVKPTNRTTERLCDRAMEKFKCDSLLKLLKVPPGRGYGYHPSLNLQVSSPRSAKTAHNRDCSIRSASTRSQQDMILENPHQ